MVVASGRRCGRRTSSAASGRSLQLFDDVVRHHARGQGRAWCWSSWRSERRTGTARSPGSPDGDAPPAAPDDGRDRAGRSACFALTGLAHRPRAEPAPSLRPPPRPPRSRRPGSDFATTMQRVDSTATPGIAGPNDFGVRVDRLRLGRPARRDAVSPCGSPRSDVPDVAPSDAGRSTADGDAWIGRRDEPVDRRRVGRHGAGPAGRASATEVPLTPGHARAAPAGDRLLAGPRPADRLHDHARPAASSSRPTTIPGSPGPNQLHLTAFDADGTGAAARGRHDRGHTGTGPARSWRPTRFGPGHFVAISRADRRRPWHFDLAATAKDGTALVGVLRRDDRRSG